MLLYVNGCFREGSRTERLASMWLERRAYEGETCRVMLSELDVCPLDALGPHALAEYSRAVKQGDYTHPMFALAKQFAQADEILVAAPFWNYGIPAKLHAYLELVCSQGVTFDVDETGAYVSLVGAKRLTYVTTAGGAKVEALDDHAFGYVRTLAQRFWHIPQVDCVAAWGLDGLGVNVDALLQKALEEG
ncbi:MAG: NAD(P)H-dependent oxidoreductase [Atopobiaceae bacterium]|nr:NAD(P)H-dependent oxidoreductase [Atopobiaceae bacterium]